MHVHGWVAEHALEYQGRLSGHFRALDSGLGFRVLGFRQGLEGLHTAGWLELCCPICVRLPNNLLGHYRHALVMEALYMPPLPGPALPAATVQDVHGLTAIQAPLLLLQTRSSAS